MLQLAQTKSISQISNEFGIRLKLIVEPKSLLQAQKLGQLEKLDQVLETLFYLGQNYEFESFVHEGKIVSKSEYRAPRSFIDLANSNVIWFMDRSIRSKPIFKSEQEYSIKLLPSEVEYFFHVLGVQVETFKSERFALFNFNQISLNEGGLSAILGGTKDGAILTALGISLNDDEKFYETGVKTNEEEIRSWLKQQTERRK